MQRCRKEGNVPLCCGGRQDRLFKQEGHAGGMQLEQSCRFAETRMTPENCRQVPVLYGYMRAKLSE